MPEDPGKTVGVFVEETDRVEHVGGNAAIVIDPLRDVGSAVSDGIRRHRHALFFRQRIGEGRPG